MILDFWLTGTVGIRFSCQFEFIQNAETGVTQRSIMDALGPKAQGLSATHKDQDTSVEWSECLSPSDSNHVQPKWFQILRVFEKADKIFWTDSDSKARETERERERKTETETETETETDRGDPTDGHTSTCQKWNTTKGA